MNLRPGARAARCLQANSKGPGAGRRRADRLARGAARLAPHPGLRTDAGSRTYHTAILARSLRHARGRRAAHAARGSRPAPPSLSTARPARWSSIPTPTTRGRSTARTSQHAAPTTVARRIRAPARRHRRRRRASGSRPTSSCPRICRACDEHGAEGIGLYRSEFLLAGAAPPSSTEEAQYAVYRSLIEPVRAAPVTIRTFDLDEAQMGDHAGSTAARAARPARPAPRPRARGSASDAAARAAARRAHGPLRIMFPFVTGVEEVRAARAAVARARRRAARARRARRRRSDRRDDRSAVGGADRRPAGAGGRLLQHRHQRSDPVRLAVDRTDDRVSRTVRAAAPAICGCCACVACRAARHAAAGVGLRRDGVRSGAGRRCWSAWG